MLRAFFGIPICEQDELLMAQLIKQMRSDKDDDPHWIDPQHWHITIKFFASVEAETLTPICESIEEVTSTLAPFFLGVRKIAGFPAANSRNIAAHLIPHKALRLIFDSLDEAACVMGIAKETRRFRPHITLAKFRSNILPFEPVSLTDFKITAKELVLYESKPAREGSHYIPLRRFPLTGEKDV